MRILISKESKKILFNYLKNSNNSKSLHELSQKLRISFNTLNNWLYNKKKYIPKNIIPENLNLEIIDEKPDNWGQVKGGKKTYKIILEKYGKNEFIKRQINGTKKSKVIFTEKEKFTLKNFSPDLHNPLFLEFYGALLGDGWLSALSYGKTYKKNIWWVGISGNSKLDQEYLAYLGRIIKKIFDRPVTTKYKKGTNAMEIILSHKNLVIFMNKQLGFPIGLKNNLKIKTSIAGEWNRMKWVIRGLFDTDGCFFFDRVKNHHYPNIEIHMKAPELLNQVEDALIQRKFKPQRKEHRIRLKGITQVTNWMKEIGSSNNKHISKYNRWLKSALVAQRIER